MVLFLALFNLSVQQSEAVLRSDVQKLGSIGPIREIRVGDTDRKVDAVGGSLWGFTEW